MEGKQTFSSMTETEMATPKGLSVTHEPSESAPLDLFHCNLWAVLDCRWHSQGSTQSKPHRDANRKTKPITTLRTGEGNQIGAHVRASWEAQARKLDTTSKLGWGAQTNRGPIFNSPFWLVRFLAVDQSVRVFGQSAYEYTQSLPCRSFFCNL